MLNIAPHTKQKSLNKEGYIEKRIEKRLEHERKHIEKRILISNQHIKGHIEKRIATNLRQKQRNIEKRILKDGGTTRQELSSVTQNGMPLAMLYALKCVRLGFRKQTPWCASFAVKHSRMPGITTMAIARATN